MRRVSLREAEVAQRCRADGSACCRCQSESEDPERARSAAHRAGGNQAVQRLARDAADSTLEVGRPGDAYEREADRVARAVLRGGTVPSVRSGSTAADGPRAAPSTSADAQQATAGSGPSASGSDRAESGRAATESAAPEPDRSAADRRPAPDTARRGQTAVRGAGGGGGDGRPLPPEVRSTFEARFGRPFDDVRIHDGPRAADLTERLGARAVTVGRDVYFGRGEFDPSTARGRALVAHELTHVVQQRGGERDSSGPPVRRRARSPRLMGKELFTSTMEICHRVLFSRTFSVSRGAVAVTADADFEHPRGEDCGPDHYEMTLTASRSLWIDQELGTCTFGTGSEETSLWGSVPDGEYYLTIFTSGSAPHCCLRGDITVSEQQGIPGMQGCTTYEGDNRIAALHGLLDVAGMIPALGVVPDAVNTGVYLIRGDWTNAGISAAAMVPVFGMGATLTRRGVKVSQDVIDDVGTPVIKQGLDGAKKSNLDYVRLGEGLVGIRGTMDNALEAATAKLLRSRGEVMLAQGDDAVRALLNYPAKKGQYTIDFITQTGSGKYVLREVKDSLDHAKIKKAVEEQLPDIADTLAKRMNDPKLGQMEVVLPARSGGGMPTLDSDVYEISGNLLLKDGSPVKVANKTVHVRPVSK